MLSFFFSFITDFSGFHRCIYYIEIFFEIPVYIGAYDSLIGVKNQPIYFHGKDGFGDLEHDKEPDLSIVKGEHAALALNNIVNNNPKAISILAVGPLTNLALAIKLNRNFGDNIKDVWIMGGNYTGREIITTLNILLYVITFMFLLRVVTLGGVFTTVLTNLCIILFII